MKNYKVIIQATMERQATIKAECELCARRKLNFILENTDLLDFSEDDEYKINLEVFEEIDDEKCDSDVFDDDYEEAYDEGFFDAIKGILGVDEDVEQNEEKE